MAGAPVAPQARVTGRAPRRRTALVALLAVLVTSAACSGSDGDGAQPARAGSDASTTTMKEPKVGPATFGANDCPDGIRAVPPVTVTCGTLTVPERHVDDRGPKVRLPVAVLDPGKGLSRRDPVLYIDGGPGADGLSQVEALSELPIAGNHVVVVVGQRGTRYADPSFDCPEMEDVSWDLLDEALGTRDARARYSQAIRACFERVSKGGSGAAGGAGRRGPDMAQYDSATSADDLEAARIALGYDEWNLYGVSYGTRLALEVIRRHPAAVRSAVLDSVYPPEVDRFATLVPNAMRAFEAVDDACNADARCSAVYPNLLDRLAAMYERLERHPVDVTVPDPRSRELTTVRWDGDRTVRAAYRALYDTSLIPLLPFLLDSFEHDEFGLATTTYLQNEDSGATMAEGLFLAVECRERAPFTDRQALASQQKDAPAWVRAAVAGEESIDECDMWKAPPADKSVTEPVRSRVPVLVLAGGFDPITPPEWGRSVAKDQAKGFFELFPTYGHAISFQPCAREMVGWFIDDPTVEPDRTCLDLLPTDPDWVLPD